LDGPLFAVAPASWYCDAKVFGDVAPFDFDCFPDYETLTEASGDKFIKSMATGWRNWGDFYYGGPYKGKNAFMDLEYDVPHNFLVQFARTGQRKYLEAARTMAQHQADIDVNHFTKWQWKHSPRHTETQAEFGHTFTRGLLENWHSTGNRRCLEAAVELGDFFAKEFPKPSTLDNERQIGWGLISLLPVYEATMARTLARRTMEMGAMTIFTVHALPFIEQSGFVRRPSDPARITSELFASENGLHAHHITHAEGKVFLRSTEERAFRIVLVRKGAWKGPGHAVLADPAGRVVQRLEFPREPLIFQRRVLEVPAASRGTYRLALRSPAAPSDRGGSIITWDVVTPQPMPAVLTTPAFQGLEYVTPRLFTKPRGDAAKIELELTGEGEGFKKAVLYDPDGNPAATLEAFVDLGDKGRYEYHLTADIPPKHRDGIWSLSLQDVSMTKLPGLSPYFATSATGFFRPDRPE
jgi:hypothetical protein